MNKNLFALAVLFCTLLVFGACSKDDDEVDEEWKAYNEELARKAAANPEYKSRASLSGNGSVYWKNTDFFEKDETPSLKITETGSPYSSDSVVARYEGWYYLEDGTKVVFDSTEKDNATTGRGFRISGMDASGTFTGVIDGWITMLTNMKVGDAVEVCIPYRLAYGAAGKYDYYTGVQSIPGYTTLWFNIKLLKIIPDNPNEYKE
ncbi:FKBP-type peptidyl-prolyl cis-trans isomerase [Dysgonomonas sp. Marseille-P4361]|uniref:FKBP-type peptidyl-prolyl cis-trans isomerase n=1 Tax=Dysgonomonas sp. Marseille-P4361 TaxID=2161820 RepID=UPI000D5574BF|nr:FKBP-type peptidyl-prolyl cis-trans isomerase [Dysgonomonas sp. Marseille-P4361]